MEGEVFKREVLAGFTSFFTVSYLFLLYPLILSEGGIPFGAALTSTTIIIAAATAFIALYANFPAVLGPGIGVGAFIIYSIVIEQQVPWEIALGLVFWTGLCVFLLSVFKIRQKILRNLPQSIKSATIGAIGIFLILVGLINLSLLKVDPETFFRFHPVFLKEHAIVLISLVLLMALLRLRFSGAFLLSILVGWALSLFLGLGKWQGFIALPHSIAPTYLKLEILKALDPAYWRAFFSLLLVTLFDSSASLTALCRIGSYYDEKGEIKNLDRIVIPDGAMSIASSLIGTTNLSFLLESSTGIKAGGRTGLSSLTAALLSLLLLFLFPFVSSIPLFATSPALFAVGGSMLFAAKEVRWEDWTEAAPALVILIALPLTFSIYQGISLGFIAYAACKIGSRRYRELHLLSWILSAIFTLHLIWTALSKKIQY